MDAEAEAEAAVEPSPGTSEVPTDGSAEAAAAVEPSPSASEVPRDVSADEEVTRSGIIMAWGALGVAGYLSYGIKKVVPIVTSGLRMVETPWQWAFLIGTLLFFAYYEGYKGFQKGFSPRVVSRAWAVSQQRYAMGPKELLKRYGAAYLLTSCTLSIFSMLGFYAVVRTGINIEALFEAMGFGRVRGYGTELGSFAIAYALHKAASPIRFPPTLSLTPTVARWIGRDPDMKESFLASSEGRPSPPFWHKALAPAFCIGYFHGTRKRVITSWCVTTGIFLIVVGVKRMANPYRAIIDAGVMLGLSWGVISIVFLYVRSLLAKRPPDYDPALPEGSPYVSDMVA